MPGGAHLVNTGGVESKGLAVKMHTSLLKPPFGYALFGFGDVAHGVSIGAIDRGIIPFVLLQFLALLLLIAFPQVSLWLPGYLPN